MDLHEDRRKYREIMNDPDRLVETSQCSSCGSVLLPGEVAFAVENYAGDYIGYLCPSCHPNRKWIWALWRDLFRQDLVESPSQHALSVDGTVHRTVH